jgi:hypothetical protein
MISLPSLKQLEKLTIDNSPVLLTAIGVVGTISTAVLTHRAAVRTVFTIERHLKTVDLHERMEFDRKKRAQMIWRLYIPPVLSGTVTCGCIIMANRIGTKRAAAVAAAYGLSERAYSEYREKVIERIGANDEQKIRTEVVRDRVLANPPNEGNVMIVGEGDHLFMEMYTGRYFRSDMESVKKARNEVNYQINTHGYASVSDFYDQLGLPHTSESDEMGWTGDKLMDIEFTAVLSEKGQPCVAINFVTGPVRNFSRFH